MFARIRPETGKLDILRSICCPSGYKEKLAKELVRFFGVKEVLPTSSARSGLYYLLKALPQKTIFLPAYTCWVVVQAARLAQKDIRYIDISLDDYNMDADQLERDIEPGAIILATHQYGIPCDIERISSIAQDHGCLVIEDSAAGFGSEFKAQKTGSFSIASIISFEKSKTLTSGKGGAILFNDASLFKKVRTVYTSEIKKPGAFFSLKCLSRLFLESALTQKWIYKGVNALFLGVNGLTTGYPKDNVQGIPEEYLFDYPDCLAKLAYLNMQKMESTIRANKDISAFYLNALRDVQGIELPKYPSHKSPVFMRFPIRVKDTSKEEFFKKYLKRGLDFGFTFPYSCSDDRRRFPNAHAAAATVLTLPIYSQLSQNDLSTIKRILDQE